MTTCTVESINALWSGLGALIAAGLWFRHGAKKIGGQVQGADFPWPGELIVLCCLAIGGFGTYWSQQSLRFYAASTYGYECQYSGGSIKIVRPE